MKKITYFMLSLFLAFLCSCHDEHDSAFSPGRDKAAVRVSFRMPDYVQVGTRVTSESNLRDVTVLQFRNGVLVKKISLADQFFLDAVDLDGLESISAASLDQDGALIRDNNENVIVFLANFAQCFPLSLSSLNEGSTTYAALMGMTATLADADALANLQFMPMTGFYYGGITTGITNQINVTLSRSLAKINFTLNADNFRHQGGAVAIMVKKIELRNVPQTVIFFPQNRPALPANNRPGEWPSTQTPYPVANGNGDSAIGTNADDFTTLGVAHNQTTGNINTNFVAYMPENARGSYSKISNNKEKEPSMVAVALQRGWTYIYVDLDFTTSDGVLRNATYKIYLGGDDKGDINLLAGTQYNVTTYLYGANDSDTRITLSSIFDPTVLGNINNYNILKPANSYIINPAISGLSNAIPLVQARNGWRHIQSSIDASGDNAGNIDYVAQFDALIASGNWELVTLWKTWSSATAVNSAAKPAGISTVGGGTTDNYFGLISGLASVSTGNNCVLALRSTVSVSGVPSGTIWWTWHLWFTDYNPDLSESDASMKGQLHAYFGDAFRPGGLYYGKKMMDRNLGATITGVDNTDVPAQPTAAGDAVKWYGMMYQWGRKDPFTSSNTGATTNLIADAVPVYPAAGGTAITYGSGASIGPGSNGSSITADLNANSADGFPKVGQSSTAINRLVDVARYPQVYFHTGAGSDWTKQDNTLWNMATKTAFDPCPPGWRVPAGGTAVAYNPWAGFSNLDPSSTTNLSGLGVGVPTVFQSWGNDGAVSATIGPRAGRLYDASAVGVGTTKTWCPASGNRSFSSGAFNNVGTTGYYWSAAVTGTNGYLLGFNNSFVYPMASNNRAYGFPVRCIAE